MVVRVFPDTSLVLICVRNPSLVFLCASNRYLPTTKFNTESPRNSRTSKESVDAPGSPIALLCEGCNIMVGP